MVGVNENFFVFQFIRTINQTTPQKNSKTPIFQHRKCVATKKQNIINGRISEKIKAQSEKNSAIVK
jgi:hypothetical protein